MTIDKHQIPCSDFIHNEVKTLGVIKELKPVANNFPELCSEAYSKFSQYSGKHKKSLATSFVFGCEIKMNIERAVRSLFVEAIIQNEYSIASYALSMCDSDTESKNLIRKFHFDYDPHSHPDTDKKPRYHLQYGGKTTPKLGENGLSSKGLHDWLSVPRLSIRPVNLALVLDTIFNEFPSEATRCVTETSEWRDLIKSNEDKILVPYYSNLSQFANHHKSSFLYRDFFYGKKH